MKKTYQTPETTIVLVQTTQMIAVSGFEETVNENPNNGVGDGNNALSRRRSIWDFDDEE